MPLVLLLEHKLHSRYPRPIEDRSFRRTARPLANPIFHLCFGKEGIDDRRKREHCFTFS